MEETCSWRRQKSGGATGLYFQAVKGPSEAEAERKPERLAEGQGWGDRDLLRPTPCYMLCSMTLLNLLLL